MQHAAATPVAAVTTAAVRRPPSKHSLEPDELSFQAGDVVELFRGLVCA